MTNFLAVPNNFQLSDLLYHNLVEQRLALNRVVKKGKFEKKENESFRYTDSSSEEEEELHVDVNFDEPTDLVINQFSAFEREFQRNK